VTYPPPVHYSWPCLFQGFPCRPTWCFQIFSPFTRIIHCNTPPIRPFMIWHRVLSVFPCPRCAPQRRPDNGPQNPLPPPLPTLLHMCFRLRGYPQSLRADLCPPETPRIADLEGANSSFSPVPSTVRLTFFRPSLPVVRSLSAPLAMI